MTDMETKTVHGSDQDGVREIAQPMADGVQTAISRAELDQAITTARAFPRSIKRFVAECTNMATLNEAVASECIYALPRDGKVIEGPSVRMAEIAVSAWGNCRAGARVVDEGAEFVTAQGVFHDLERNVHITMEVRRRITTKNGKRYGSDMIGVAGNAACSIAMRNAVFRGIPKALWSDIYQQARAAAVGNVQTLANKRAAAMQHLQKLGVTSDRVFAVLQVQGVEDIGVDQLATLRGLANAIKDGETTPEDAFPMIQKEEKAPPPKRGVEGLVERARAATAKAEAPAAGDETEGGAA